MLARETNSRARSLSGKIIDAIGGMLAAAFAVVGYRGLRRLKRAAPEFRKPLLLIPLPLRLLTSAPMRHFSQRTIRPPQVPEGIVVNERFLSNSATELGVRTLIFCRKDRARNGPVLLWLHGGGFITGSPEIDVQLPVRILDTIDITIVSVDYRLAPENPFPAAMDDAFAAYEWIVANAADLGVDPKRIAVGGGSAGAGLAAALVQRLVDSSLIDPVFQLLLYPMLDDRTVLREDHSGRGELLWRPADNHYGWSSYLGYEPGAHIPPQYAVPARRPSLRGLPAAWIGVGTLDLFYQEDQLYASRLVGDDVPCRFEEVVHAPHGFDLLAFDAPVVRAFHLTMTEALAAGVGYRTESKSSTGT